MERYTQIDWRSMYDSKEGRIHVPREGARKYFHTKERPEKDRVRTETVDFIKQWSKTTGKRKFAMLSLPGIDWLAERELYRKLRSGSKKNSGVLITGLERDYRIFKVAAANIPRRSGPRGKLDCSWFNHKFSGEAVNNGVDMTLQFGDIFEYARTRTHRKFDIVWLDTMSKCTNIAEKLEWFREAIQQQCVFIITLFKGREIDLKKLAYVNYNRTTYISEKMAQMGFSLVHEWSYRDTGPMLHLIYTR